MRPRHFLRCTRHTPDNGLADACLRSKKEGYPDGGGLGGGGRGAGSDSNDEDGDDDDTMGLCAGSGVGGMGLKADAGTILKIAGDAGGCHDDSDAIKNCTMGIEGDAEWRLRRKRHKWPGWL